MKFLGSPECLEGTAPDMRPSLIQHRRQQNGMAQKQLPSRKNKLGAKQDTEVSLLLALLLSTASLE